MNVETQTPPFVDAKNLSSLGFPELDGIWTNCFEPERMRLFMSEHYMSDASAQSQVATMDNSDYYSSILRRVIADRAFAFALDSAAPLRVLELGAGSGGGTIAALKVFPQAHLTASDYSLAMLGVLKGDLQKRGLLERCTLCQIDAETLAFPENTFDVVLGAAMLHHLFFPEKAIQNSYRILKPGGSAIFFEPFELGMKMIGMIYQSALSDPRSYFMDRRIRTYMKNSLRVWNLMCVQPKDEATFAGIDDKSLFTSGWLRRIGREAGFSKIEISSLYQGETPFRDLIKSHMDANKFITPKWIWAIVDKVEANFSSEAKQDLFTEGVVTFTK